jgi:hypothetical protein
MTFAQFIGVGPTGNLTGGGIIGVISTVIVPVIFSLAFAAFIWGVIKYFFLHGGEETARKEGREFILWGIVGMAVLFSVWTLVKLLLSTLGIAPSA